MAVVVKRALGPRLLAISCQATLAAADEKYGSFGAQVSDGSALKHYKAFGQSVKPSCRGAVWQ